MIKNFLNNFQYVEQNKTHHTIPCNDFTKTMRYDVQMNDQSRLISTTFNESKIKPKKSIINNKSYGDIEENQSNYKNFSLYHDKSQFSTSNFISNDTLKSINDDVELPPDFTKSIMKDDFEKSESEGKYEVLTKEKIEESITLNFRKCYNLVNAATRGNVTLNKTSKANISMSEEFENATKTFPNLSRFKPNLARTNETTCNNFTNTVKTLNFNESNFEEEQEESFVNDTITFSIKDPFNYEYKNRLLARHQKTLNEFKNLTCLDVKKPNVAVKGFVAIGI